MTDETEKPKLHPGMNTGGKAPRTVLSDFERAFCLHYVGAAGGIGANACRMAGYKPVKESGHKRRAWELLQRPLVVEEIERLRAARVERLTITADDVLADLIRVRDKARLLPQTSANLKVELAAIEKIGDHVGVAAFRRQLGIGNPNGGPIEAVDPAALARLTDEELHQLERAREILDRAAGINPDDSQPGSAAPGA